MTIGIVGHGELGSAVEEIARQFNMQVLIARRRGASVDPNDGRVDFEELVERADVISLHCPLNDDTQNMFAAEQFRKMKSNAILINTARGGLVDSVGACGWRWRAEKSLPLRSMSCRRNRRSMAILCSTTTAITWS